MSKYIKYYNNLIANAQTRIICGYTENHHIIPKCMGGTNNKENLVRLTAREHYVAHQLLVKIYPGNNKLIYACLAMCIENKTHTGSDRINNRIYEWLRIKCSESLKGKNNPFYGKKHTEETRKLISIAAQNRTGWTHSEESKTKMSNSQLGSKNHNYGKQASEETRNKLRLANTGRITSEETKKKISKSNKGNSKLRKFGESNPFFGKHHTQDTIDKIRKANVGHTRSIKEKNNMFGKMWITNPITNDNLVISKDVEIPQGWIKGRYCKKRK